MEIRALAHKEGLVYSWVSTWSMLEERVHISLFYCKEYLEKYYGHGKVRLTMMPGEKAEMRIQKKVGRRKDISSLCQERIK